MDLVFVDPPIGWVCSFRFSKNSAAWAFLGSPATLVAQSEQKEVLPPRVSSLEMVKSRIYGETRITLYRREGQE